MPGAPRPAAAPPSAIKSSFLSDLIRTTSPNASEDSKPETGDVMPNGTVPDSRTTAPQYCEAVPGGLVFKARRLLYHSTLGRE